MNRPVQQYLRQATRGLWGTKRREVQAELLGHIEARVQEFQLAGLHPQDALHRTLTELGAPDQVRRGMTHVYLAPVAINGVLVSTLAAAAVLTLGMLASGRAQVSVYDPSTSSPPTAFFVDGEELLDELRQRGAQVSGSALQPTIVFPGHARAVQVDWTKSGQSTTNPQDQRTYVSVNALTSAVSTAGLPVHVQGWTNPTLLLSSLPVQLGDPAQRVDAFALYTPVLNEVVREVLGPGAAHALLATLSADFEAARWTAATEKVEHTLNVVSRPGVVYALLIVEPSVNAFGTRHIPHAVFDITPDAGDGTLRFVLPKKYTHLQLTGRVQEAREAHRLLARNDDAAQHHGGPGRPAVALLVELNGNLGQKTGTYTMVSIDRSSLGTSKPQ